MNQMKQNIKNNRNEICKKVSTVDVLRLMGDKLEDEDEEEIKALKERKGNAVAMDKLLEFLPRRRGALHRFLAVLRHEDFNGDYDYLADKIEGISPPGNGSIRPPNRSNQPASLAFPHQVSTSEQVDQDEIDGGYLRGNKNVGGERLPGQFGTESYRVQTGGEPYTVARGQAANIQSTVRQGGGPQVLPSGSSTSSVDLSDLERRGEIPVRPQETPNKKTPCVFCDGQESGSFFEKHNH